MSVYEDAVGFLRMRGVSASKTVPEPLIADLKERGLTISECIKAVRESAGISLGEAKLLISESLAWRDAARSGKALHQEAESVLDSFPSEDPRGPRRSG